MIQSAKIYWLKAWSSATSSFVVALIFLSGCSHRVITVPVRIDSVPQGCPVDVDGINKWKYADDRIVHCRPGVLRPSERRLLVFNKHSAERSDGVSTTR
jgi:hypothetical protein